MAKKAAVTGKSTKIEKLEHDNEVLEAENERLKAKATVASTQNQKSGNIWRGLITVMCVALATAILIVGNLLFWAGNTIVNTDKYVQTVQPLLQDKAVQEAVAGYTTTQLFRQVDVTQTVQNALPPRAAFLAPQLTSQLQGATDKSLQKILASNKFQSVWANTNRAAHDKLITSIKNSKGDGVVNLQDVYDSLSQNLKNTKLSFLANKSLPQNIGSITLIHAAWVPEARTFIKAVGWLKPVSLLLLGVFSAAAIYLARNRRKLVIMLGSFFSAGMVALLIAIPLTQHTIATRTAPVYQTAADHAARILMHSLVLQTETLLLLSLLIVIIAWLTGPYRLALALTGNFDRHITTPLHRVLFGQQNSVFTRWIGKYKQLLEWAIVAVIGVVMLWVRLSPKLVGSYAVLMLILVFVTETLAAPHSKR